MKKILFLSAYDYSACFNLIDTDSLFIAVPENDPAFDDSLKKKYHLIFNNRYFEISYKNDSLSTLISKLNPEILISFGWRRIIKQESIKNVPLKINIHPAILPQYKGYHPVPYVLINNESEHGITAHLLTEDLDAGDIVHIKKFSINSFSTARSLQFKVNEMMPLFVKELLDILVSENIHITPNDNLQTRIIAPKRTPEDSEMDIQKPLGDLYNFIRACDNERFPAFFYKDGTKIFITLNREMPNKETPFDI